GAVNVLVSLGGDGALLIDEFSEVHTIGTVKDKVVNTVGSGDSMVAGFIAGYLSEKDYDYALKLGTACGCATAFLPGLATREKIKETLSKL
ncbi:MAG: PfkB family carbohydrate kinase, partial [Ruminococcus sp.]